MQCELLTTYLLCILNKFISMCTRSYTIKSDPRKHNVALTLFFPERKTLIEVIRIIKYSAFYKFSPAIELLLRHFFLTCPNDICIEKLCLEKVMGLDGFFLHLYYTTIHLSSFYANIWGHQMPNFTLFAD